MSNQSIKYGILLTKEQLDFLKDDRQGFHRMTAFDTFVSMAFTKPSVYQKAGFSDNLEYTMSIPPLTISEMSHQV